MTVDVVTLVLLGLAAALGAGAGWYLQGIGAKRQATDLKRTIFESKGAIPQLEAAVRTRDQRLASHAQEIDALKARITTLDANVNEKSGEIVKRDRELRRLANELAIANESAVPDSVSLVEGLADEVPAAPAPGAEAAALAARLKKSETRYEALKRGLIARDDRISALEAELKSAAAPTLSQARAAEIEARAQAAEAHATVLAARDAQIRSLEARLAAQAEQREVLETLAKGRAAGNKELRDNAAKLGQQAAALRETIKLHASTVAERDAAIDALEDSLAESRAESAQRAERIESLERALVERDLTLTQERAATQSLRDEAAARTARIEALQGEVAAAVGATARAESALQEQLAARDAVRRELDAALAGSREHDAVREALEQSLRDRDFRIDALTADVSRLTSALEAAVAAAKAPPPPTYDATAAEARIAALSQHVDLLERDAVLRERRFAEQERERAREAEQLGTRLAAAEAPRDTPTHALEAQLAAARERCQRVEDELLEVAREAKTLRTRLAGIEGDRTSDVADAEVPVLSRVVSAESPTVRPI
jgi:chromosome segregation ATPase